MSLTRSPPNKTDFPPPLPVASGVIEPASCRICNKCMHEGDACLSIHACSHAFHRACIENFLANSSECPVCRRPCRLNELRPLTIRPSTIPPSKCSSKGKGKGAIPKPYNTRSAVNTIVEESGNMNSKQIDTENIFASPKHIIHEEVAQTAEARPPEQENRANAGNAVITSEQMFEAANNVNIIPRVPLEAERHNNFQVDYETLNNMIENNISKLLQRLNIPKSGHLPNSHVLQEQVNNTQQNSNANHFNLLDEDYYHNDNHFRPGLNDANQVNRHNSNYLAQSPNPPTNFSNTTFHADKMTLIIQNWNLKFDGSSTGLNIEEFLYRVRSLTYDNFNGDFSIICRNLHILLTGKAREWYWRYHKRVQVIEGRLSVML